MRFLFSILLSMVLAALCAAQSRDYLTDAEIELVRDAQQIDKRIDILTQAIDRRFAILNVNVSAPVRKTDAAAWGPAPAGTRSQMLYDIKRILQKAIDDIDNLSSRPDSMVVDVDAKKKPEGFSVLFPRAVRILAAAAERYRDPLKAQLDAPGDGFEKGPILDALDMCGQITAAAAKLPKESVPEKEKKN